MEDDQAAFARLTDRVSFSRSLCACALDLCAALIALRAQCQCRCTCCSCCVRPIANRLASCTATQRDQYSNVVVCTFVCARHMYTSQAPHNGQSEQLINSLLLARPRQCTVQNVSSFGTNLCCCCYTQLTEPMLIDRLTDLTQTLLSSALTKHEHKYMCSA